MADAPRTVAQALAYARAEHENETEDWTGYCQRFVRSCYALPSLFGSAWAQWLGADADDKHPGDNPADAPVGAALCFRGGTYGHIMLAANERPDGTAGAWSNDLVRTGDIDHVARTAPEYVWGHVYVGWLSAVNDYDLQLDTDKPPQPRQDKHYQRIARAIEKLEAARTVAAAVGEKRDAKMLTAEIRDLRDLYAELRHA